MNNNKPIINGIDVSECKYLNKVINEEPYCNIDQEHLYTCSSDENCYFKQLKRLQEENEELQYSLKTQCVTCKRELENCRILFIADKYKQALEEIRDIVSDEIDKTDADDELMQIYGTIYNRCNEVLNDRD